MTSRINAADFDLAASLECGQAFRWKRAADGWFVGVVEKSVWRLRQDGAAVEWQAAGEEFVRRYLALNVSLSEITATFPGDPLLQLAVANHWGLRVLRQEPWECLASFIASSTKQVVQIRQIVENLAQRFGKPLDSVHFGFPAAAIIARATEQQLRDCKLGFRAKYLLDAARSVDSGALDFAAVRRMELPRALEELTKLTGVGEKIASCALLFSCGFEQAFPIDVWVQRALQRLYFPRRKASPAKVRALARSHFGPYAGWAQQYLFFQERTRGRKALLNRGA